MKNLLKTCYESFKNRKYSFRLLSKNNIVTIEDHALSLDGKKILENCVNDLSVMANNLNMKVNDLTMKNSELKRDNYELAELSSGKDKIIICHVAGTFEGLAGV